MFNIDSQKCTGCGSCVDVCPQRAISLQDDTAVINQQLCRECGICAETCPVNAIVDLAPVFSGAGEGDDEMIGRSWPGRGHRGRGRGNARAFCRFYPWLPRRWWAYGPGSYSVPSPYAASRPYRW